MASCLSVPTKPSHWAMAPFVIYSFAFIGASLSTVSVRRSGYWAAERTSYPNHVVEQALAHTIGNAVERAYRRGDLLAKRAHLMADWAHFCTTKPLDVSSVVTPIRGRA